MRCTDVEIAGIFSSTRDSSVSSRREQPTETLPDTHTTLLANIPSALSGKTAVDSCVGYRQGFMGWCLALCVHMWAVCWRLRASTRLVRSRLLNAGTTFCKSHDVGVHIQTIDATGVNAAKWWGNASVVQ
jgi:hypothetical protein